MRKGIVACISMIVGLVLLIVSFLEPWYLINASGLLGAEYNMEIFLTQVQLQGNLGGQDVSLSMGYAEVKTNVQNTDVNIKSFTTIETAMYLTLLAMATAVIAIVCMAAFVFNKGKPKMMKLLGGLFGFLTFLFTIIPVLYFMNTEFVENSSGFWFSVSALGMTLTGGPGYAWYLMIAVAIIAVICAVTFLVKKVTLGESLVE
jgi:drug/metabolite transporter (DMT)-like permease